MHCTWSWVWRAQTEARQAWTDVEHLKRLVTQLLASSSTDLTIADQVGESAASDAGGASDPKGKGKAKLWSAQGE